MRHFPTSWCSWDPVKQCQVELLERLFQVLHSVLQIVKEYMSKLWKILCEKSNYEICIYAPLLDRKKSCPKLHLARSPESILKTFTFGHLI